MVNKTNENTIIMLKSMAVGFYDGGIDDGDNGGNDPLIRELDLDLVTRVPPESSLSLLSLLLSLKRRQLTRLQILERVLERERE